MSKQPKNMIIIGSGPIGCELAQAFQRLGTQVTLVNRSDRILSKEDKDVQEHMINTLKKEGVKMTLGCSMKNIEQTGEQKLLHIEQDGDVKTLTAEEILVAVGRTSNADTLKVQNAGIELDEKGYIKTDKFLRTNVSHIWAAGDITGHLQFTHSAGYEAGIIVRNAILLPSFLQKSLLMKKYDLSTIPWTTYTDPEVASTGINETEAKQRGIEHTVSVFELEHQDRALAEGQNSGFIKLILSPKDSILGCQIVGPHAGELIHEWILARNLKAKLSTISRMTHVYPTLAGANQQAAGSYLGDKFFNKSTRSKLRKFLGYRNLRIDNP